MSSLKEALEGSGLVQEIQHRADVEKQVAEQARKERVAAMQPHQRWWQNFRMPVTQFEIVVFIKVQSDSWLEAVRFIAKRNLNRLTTRCKTREEAVDQIRTKILAWQAENVLSADKQPPAGALLYWRIYDKEGEE